MLLRTTIAVCLVAPTCAQVVEPASREAREKRIASAIDEGLRWLRSQQPDEVESWPCPDAPAAATATIGELGVTSAALLAFLADGSTMRGGRHRDAVRRAVIWIYQSDREGGAWLESATRLDRALAATALTEAHGLSNYKLLRRPAEKVLRAVSKDVHRRSDEDPDVPLDTTWLRWASAAQRAARDFDIGVEVRPREQLELLLELALDPASGRARSDKRVFRLGRLDEARPSTFGLAPTTDLLRARIALGVDTPELWLERIAKRPPMMSPDGAIDDPDHWMAASSVVAAHSKERWTEWAACLDPVLDAQKDDGSWPVSGILAAEGGAVYATAMIVLTLQARTRFHSK